MTTISNFTNLKTVAFVVFGFFAVFLFVFPSYAQNKFEGYNIILDVPRNHQSAVCALRYAPPSNDIIISDFKSGDTYESQTLRGFDGANFADRLDGEYASQRERF